MTFTKKMMTATAALAITAGAAFADAHKMNPMVGGAEMSMDMNIVENAANSADHTTLVAAVQAAGLAETLSGEGPFTVFAPTNEAFDRLEPGTVETLLMPENKEMLVKILTCHVVAADVMSDAIVGMIEADGGTHAVTTLGGCVLQASVEDDMVKLVDENENAAFVEIADVKQSNGVIHVINGVMLPKQ
jgi:uncharacterized surface protein with fasciclin (FAS1) repeats